MKSLLLRVGGAAVIAAMVVGVCSADETGAKTKREVNFKVSEEATVAEAGLPAYPGSKPYKEPNNSSAGATVGISSPLFGLKVVAINLESVDHPSRVAAFYLHAMSKYGNVLDCSSAEVREKWSASRKKERDDEDSEQLFCDRDEITGNKVVYKVGKSSNQRIVSIKPFGDGARFAVVHVQVNR